MNGNQTLLIDGIKHYPNLLPIILILVICFLKYMPLYVNQSYLQENVIRHSAATPTNHKIEWSIFNLHYISHPISYCISIQSWLFFLLQLGSNVGEVLDSCISDNGSSDNLVNTNSCAIHTTYTHCIHGID